MRVSTPIPRRSIFIACFALLLIAPLQACEELSEAACSFFTGDCSDGPLGAGTILKFYTVEDAEYSYELDTVIATTRHPGKADLLKREGADIVIDSGRDDTLQEIRAATNGEGADAAVEYTGATELMRLCIDALRLGGTLCPVGGEIKPIPLRVVDMVSKELNVHGIRGATRNDQRVVAELLAKGRFVMPVHAVLPLSQAGKAHAMLEDGKDLVGRIVLHPWDED